MSYFKAKMHQIQFPLGLRPRPHWGSIQRSPDPLARFKGLLLRGWKGEEGREKGERRGGEKQGRKRKRGERGGGMGGWRKG